MFRSSTRLRFAAVFAVLLTAAVFAAVQFRPVAVVDEPAPRPTALAPSLDLTKSATLSGDVNGNGVVNPGDTLGYSVVVTNSGTDASGVVFTDVLNSNLTLVPGSVNASPVAADDSYASYGNVGINVPAASGVTVNDTDPDGGSFTVSGFGATSGTANGTTANGTNTVTTANNGTVRLSSDGSFAYDPGAGFEGSDTFYYTIKDAANTTGIGAVTVTVSGGVWFVNNSAPACTSVASNCGRLSNPFSDLASLASINDGSAGHPAAGDAIFVFTGGGNYTGALTLLNGQFLVGQGAGASLASIASISLPPFSNSLPATGGTNPVLTGTTTTVTVSTNNTVRGLNINSTAGTAIAGTNFGGLVLGEVSSTANNSGGTCAAAVSLDQTGGPATINAVFRSISASNCGNGIVLRNTSGSFTVNGDGADTSVGGNSSGGTISNAAGADGAVAGNAVYLENTTNVVLRRLTINGVNSNHGIRGVGGTSGNDGFTLEYSTVSGTNGNNAALDEGSVNLDNLDGSAAITSSVIEGGFKENLSVVNTSGILNRLVVSGSTFGFNNTANGGNSILIASQGFGTTLNFTLRASLIKGARADWINVANNSASSGDTVIEGNTFDNLGSNAHPGASAGSNRIVYASAGSSTVDVKDNSTQGSKGEAIRIRSTGGTGSVNARVRDNSVGVATTANSGSSEGSGIFAFGDGGSDMNIAVTNNQVFQYNNHGIRVDFGDELVDGSVFNATVTGNTVASPGTNNTDFNGFHLNNGTVATTDNFTSCVDIGGAGGLANVLTGSGKGAASPSNQEIRLRQRQSTTVRLPGYGGGNTDTSAVVAYLQSRNTMTAGNGAASTQAPGGGFIGGAACAQPSIAAAAHADESSRSSLARADLGTDGFTGIDRASTAVAATPGFFAELANKLLNEVSPVARAENQASKPMAGETITVNGTGSGFSLPAGKTTTITFRATIDPASTGTSVSNQASATANGVGSPFFSNTVATPVVQAVSIAKAFAPDTIATGGSSTVTLTLTNAGSTTQTGASFSDTLTNMSAVGGAVGGTCVGTTPNTLVAGATNLGFSGITVPANSSCTVTFAVTSGTVGIHPNSTSGVATEQATGGAGSNTANLRVVDANIQLSPLTATNNINTNHVITITVNALGGTIDAGTHTATAAIASGPGSFVGGNTCTYTGGAATASCTVTITSGLEGTTVVSASSGIPVNGQSITRGTGTSANTASGGSGNASKTWVDPRAFTTTTILSDGPDPSHVGDKYTVVVAVRAVLQGSGNPTGTVTVSDGAGATCTVNLANPTCQMVSQVAGMKTLTATYSGDTAFRPSSGTAQHDVVVATNVQGVRPRGE